MSESVRVVDVADVPIRFVASDRARTEAIEAVVGALPVHPGRAALTVTFGSGPVPLPSRPWDHADGDVRAWWEGDDLLFLAHGAFSCRVTDSTAVIGGHGKFERGFRQLLPHILTQLLATRDRFVIHAGAVERRGRAVLILGGSGSGKSTVVVAALRGGWSALADDLVVVRDPASPEACGIPKPIAGPAEVVRSSGLPARPLHGDPRGRWLVVREPKPGWFPVVGTVVATGSAEPRPALEPLSSPRLVECLLLSFLSAKQPVRRRDFLPVAAALTCRRGWAIGHQRVESESLRRIGQLLDQLPPLQQRDGGATGWSGSTER